MTKKNKKRDNKVENRACRIVFDILIPLENINESLNDLTVAIQDFLNKSNKNCNYASHRIFYKEEDYE